MNVEQIIKSSKAIPLRTRSVLHLTLITGRMNEAITHALKPYDVSIQQFNVLRILKGQQGKPANLSTLNDRMVTKMSNTTRLVDKLIQKGFVNRKVCPENRRKIEIRITEAGDRSLLEMSEAVAAAEHQLLIHLSDEQLTTLNDLLNLINVS